MQSQSLRKNHKNMNERYKAFRLWLKTLPINEGRINETMPEAYKQILELYTDMDRAYFNDDIKSFDNIMGRIKKRLCELSHSI